VSARRPSPCFRFALDDPCGLSSPHGVKSKIQTSRAEEQFRPLFKHVAKNHVQHVFFSDI
jgi:hypothetical protein